MAREVDFSAHLGVLGGRYESLALLDGWAMDRVDDDLDAVLMARRRRAREHSRIVLLSVHDAQPVFKRSITTFFFGPTFWIFPFFKE